MSVLTDLLVRVAVSLLPVLLFLFALVYLDTYKFMRLRYVLLAVFVGCLAALASLFANEGLSSLLGIDGTTFRRYIAPVVEEAIKGSYVVFLIARRRVGFMVDAAITGFAIGAGFAIVENAWYVGTLDTDNILVWIVRGFGTAVMHGGMTALFAIVSKSFFDRSGGTNPGAYLLAFLFASALHSIYNHFPVGPLLTTLIIYLTLPIILLFVFYRSERSTRGWLGQQMDVDAELLEMIHSGNISATPIGRYFQTIRDRFPPEMVFDMVCYLRLHAQAPPGTAEHFDELHHLEKSIGRTGRLALMPFLHTTPRETFQLHMLERMVR
jgi:RsiW-degrading membrane proteinase PrsW (M82 family)